ALMTRLLKMPIEMLLPPGYTNMEAMKRIKATRANVSKKPQSVKDIVDAGVVIVGSPSTVREKLEAYQELAGFGTVLTKTQFGTMPNDMVRTNMAAIAEEVL